MLSSVKAEKVVKPPQMPVIKKSFQSTDEFVLKLMPQNKPIKKQPIILIKKVAVGNVGEKFVLTNLLHR